jgi:hypothetical protein
MGGNLWPLILNDQPQLERGKTWTVPQHRRDQAVEAIASAAIRRCCSTRPNNRSMGEPQGASAIPRAATVYLEHVATELHPVSSEPGAAQSAIFCLGRRDESSTDHPRPSVRPIPRSELDGEAGKDISINGIVACARRGVATDRARFRGRE